MEMKRKNTNIIRYSNQGFTMVELLVAMVISLLAMAAIYSTFLTQFKSYQVQEETAEMQQNIRAAMYFMQREIRMVGCDPQRIGGFGITQVNGGWANANSIRFTEDVRGAAVGSPPDGDVTDPGEDIAYSVDPSFNLIRTDYNGGGVGTQVAAMVAQNINAIDFVYWDGADPPVRLNPFGAGLTNVAAANLNNIRSVEITIVARTSNNLLPSTNSRVYVNQQGDTIYGPPNDNFSRRRLTFSLRCRNLGL